jgi:cell division GTPase FtsZ
MSDFDFDVPANLPAQEEPKPQAAPAAPQSGQLTVDLPDLDMGNGARKVSATAEPDQKELAVKFGIIGSGQGGSRLADTFYQLGYRRVCAVNTTQQDFLGLELPEKSQLVFNESEGGAGKDLSKGKEALDKSNEEVMNLMRRTFGDDVEHIMVCIGAGGGSGSGSVLGLIKLARYYFRQLNKPEKVGVIVSMPKYIEGGKVQANALEVLSSLTPEAESKALSPFVLVDNESIHQMFPDVSAKKFWQTANRNAIGLFDIFNVLAAQKSAYHTFDRADYRNMLSSGIIIFGATKLDSYKSDTDISDGLRTNLKRTLLADVELTSATHVAGILAAPDAILEILPQSHIDLAFATLERVLGGGDMKQLTVHQGVYEASPNKMGLFLYTMVGGLKMPQKRLAIMKNRSGI